MPIGRLENVKISEFKNLMDLNLIVPLEMIQISLAELRSRMGSIVLISSGASSKPYDTWGPYCISKAALNMLAACVGAEEPQVSTIALRPGNPNPNPNPNPRRCGYRNAKCNSNGRKKIRNV